MIRKILGALVAPVLFLQLSHAQQVTVKPLVKPTAADLARGAKIYKANCVRCHNADPNKKGNLGPEQVDAPIEVVYSKIMTGRYPEPLPKGFVPKRKTKAMTPLKNLQKEIPYLHAWIQSVKKKK